MRVAQKLGVPFGGPYNQGSSILGAILGPPVYMETTIRDLGLLGFGYVGIRRGEHGGPLLLNRS